MHKLIVTLTNHPSALEKNIFDGNKVFEIFVEDPTNHEEILNKAEPKATELRGDSKEAIRMEVADESGAILISGTVKDGFNGVIMS